MDSAQMAQVHSTTTTMTTTTPTTTSQKSVEKKGLRYTFRRWRESFWMTKPSPSPPRQPHPQPTHPPGQSLSTPTHPRQPPQSTTTTTTPRDPNAAALFKPTTQTIIHSPLDKRNKASYHHPSSSSSTLRRSYLGARRNTAPADYFTFGSARVSTERKDPWGGAMTSSPETAGPAGSAACHSRRPSLLKFSLSRRGSVQQAVAAAGQSAAMGTSGEGERCVRQGVTTTTGEMAALVRKHEDKEANGRKDTPNESLGFEQKERDVEQGAGEMQREEVERKEEKAAADAAKPSTDEKLQSPPQDAGDTLKKQE